MPQSTHEAFTKSARSMEQESGKRTRQTPQGQERAGAPTADSMATVHHELRNHLQMIGNVTQLLAQAPGGEHERFLQLLEDSSTCLAGLVKDLVDYHRREAARRGLR